MWFGCILKCKKKKKKKKNKKKIKINCQGQIASETNPEFLHTRSALGTKCAQTAAQPNKNMSIA